MMKHLLIFFILLALLPVQFEPAAAQSETKEGVIVIAEEHRNGVRLVAFADAVPGNWSTPPDADPRYQIEIILSETSDGTCKYRVGNTGNEYVTVNRERADVQVTITDLETNTQIASETFVGTTPRGCPDSVRCSTSQGHTSCNNVWVRPDEAAFAAWLTATMTGLPDLEASMSTDISMVITEQGDRISSAIYDPSGQFVLTYSYYPGPVSIWDAVTGEKVGQLGNGGLSLQSASYSPDGRFIVTIVAGGNLMMTIWDATTGEFLRNEPDLAGRYFNHDYWVESARYSPDGNFILTTEGGILAGIRDASTGEELLRLMSTDIRSAAYSPDGRFIVTGNSDGMARIWDASTGEVVRQLAGHTEPVTGANYSPDGQFIVTVSFDRTVRLWDTATGEEVRQMLGNTDNVRSASYSPDGRLIVTTGRDNTLRIWDISNGEEIRSLSNHGYTLSYASFSPDGRFILASSSDGTAIIWDVSDLLNAS